MYKFSYSFVTFSEHEPVTDLLSITTIYGGLGDYGLSLRSDVDVFRYMPLSELLKYSVTRPLLAQ